MYKLVETTLQEYDDKSRRPSCQRIALKVHTTIATGLTFAEAKARRRGHKNISIVKEKP